MSVNYIKEHIKIQRDSIKNQLNDWRKQKNQDIKTLWGNRVRGNIQALEFCLEKIEGLLELDCLKINEVENVN